MKAKNYDEYIFVKVSGDCAFTEEFVRFIEELNNAPGDIVVCVGGGTQINKALKDQGFELKPHGPLGRETGSDEERHIANSVLNGNVTELQHLLDEKGDDVTFMTPVIEVGGVECHMNGDEMVRAAYHGFDKLYVVTTREREDAKKKLFAELPKVIVKGI